MDLKTIEPYDLSMHTAYVSLDLQVVLIASPTFFWSIPQSNSKVFVFLPGPDEPGFMLKNLALSLGEGVICLNITRQWKLLCFGNWGVEFDISFTDDFCLLNTPFFTSI